MKKIIFYPTLLFLITLCSVPLSGKSTLSNNYNINPPPKITSYTLYATAKVGGHAHIECTVEPQNDPTLTAEIYFNGKPLIDSWRYKITYSYGYFVFEIYPTLKMDEGLYTFIFTNKYGKALIECTLKVEGTE